jgi:heavy metal sensor kinase
MSLSKILRLPNSLALRLALWYALIFTISSFGAFLVFNLLITSGLRERTDKELLTEISELSSHLVFGGLAAVELDIIHDADSSGMDRMFLRLLSSAGETLVSSNMSSWGDITINRTALDLVSRGSNHVFETLNTSNRKHKVRILYGAIGPDKILQMGKSLEDDERFMEALRESFVVLMAVLMGVGALIGWFMAKRALLGVEEVTRTAEEISEGDIERRVPLRARGAEIERLANTFNNMVDRIHALLRGMREMTDNIAHDLKSPITRIRGIAEMTMTNSDSLDEFKAMAANTIEECDNLLEMIKTMLDISELEAGAGDLVMREVDMATVVADACELFQPLAEDKDIAVVIEVSRGAFVDGDIQRLQRMVANLLDNAIKYTPPEGTVTVSINGDTDQIILSVSDTGVGISGEGLAKVFERFYRCDPSRSHDGVGLGLSLVMAIACSHGGDVAVTSAPEKGSTFTVSLPRKSFS